MTVWPYTCGFCDRLGVDIWVTVCFDFAKYFFIEFIQNVKMCREWGCVIHSGVFKLFKKHRLHNKQWAVHKLPVYIYSVLLPLQEKALFPIRTKKWLLLPDRTLFTCTSCSQLPASTCRTPSSCTEIGSCFKNKQEKRPRPGAEEGCYSEEHESCINLLYCLFFLLWNSWVLTPGLVSDHL